MEPRERIEEIAKYLGTSIKGLSDSIGLPHPQTLYDIQKGKTKGISKKVATLILKEIPEISRVWLLTGEGDMLTSGVSVCGENNVGINSITHSKVSNSFNRDKEIDLRTALEAYQSHLTKSQEQLTTSQTHLTKSQEQLSTSQTQLTTSQQQTSQLIQQLKETHNQITELIELLKSK